MIYTSDKGIAWYLHSRETHFPRNNITATTFYFKKEKGENYYDQDLPIKYTVKLYNGLPLVVKK